MARVSVAAPVAPRLRITRRTSGQRRHLPRIERAVADFHAFAAIDDGAARRMALARRLGALRTALLRSPFHAERLRREGLAPSDLRALDDLGGFPTMDRGDLRDHYAELPALPGDPADLAGLVAVESSGSSGVPVSILRDEYECLHMWALLRFFVERLRVALPPRPRVVLLCALASRLEYSTRAPLLGHGALHRLSTLRDDAPARLRRAAPAVIFSDPAGLHWLASQRRPPRPRLVLSAGQYLSPPQRETLARAVPAPLVNYYATTDTGPIAWECLEGPGRFHVLLPDVWVESLGGELAVTRLRPSPLPLLRYRTGDRGRVEEDACPCGYRGWSILGFEGRRACWLRQPGGERVDAWRLAPVFKSHPLSAFRLTQTAASTFRLQLVEAHVPADLQPRLIDALRALGWNAPVVAVEPASPFETRGGKPEPFAVARQREDRGLASGLLTSKT